MVYHFIWLVVWNMAFIFPYIGYVIIPIDFHIFQKGRYTINQLSVVKGVDKPFHSSTNGPGTSIGPSMSDHVGWDMV